MKKNKVILELNNVPFLKCFISVFFDADSEVCIFAILGTVLVFLQFNNVPNFFFLLPTVIFDAGSKSGVSVLRSTLVF